MFEIFGETERRKTMVPIDKTWKRKISGETWRVAIGRNPFAGFWCGYVAVPKSFLEAEEAGYINPPKDDDWTAPEEITMCEVVPGIGRVIGFDLGHLRDLNAQITEKDMQNRTNLFASWVANYYCVAAYNAGMLAMENAARKFVTHMKGKNDAEDERNP